MLAGIDNGALVVSRVVGSADAVWSHRPVAQGAHANHPIASVHSPLLDGTLLPATDSDRLAFTLRSPAAVASALRAVGSPSGEEGPGIPELGRSADDGDELRLVLIERALDALRQRHTRELRQEGLAERLANSVRLRG